MSVFDDIIARWREQGYPDNLICWMLTAWPESHQMNELEEIIDPDEIQREDEGNKKWADSWKKKVAGMK